MSSTNHCPQTGKRRFRDHAHAVEALHRAQGARHRADLDEVASRRQERRTYSCVDCNGWHLTSQDARPARIPVALPVATVWTPRVTIPRQLRPRVVAVDLSHHGVSA